MSNDMDEQLKLVHKVAVVVDRANKKICATLLRYDVDKPESSYARIRFFARKKEDEKFQQVVFVNYKLEEIIFLFDVRNSVYDKVSNNEPFVMFYKSLFIGLLFIIFFNSSQHELAHWS